MLTRKVRLRSRSVVSRMVLPRATPALLMRIVGLPREARIWLAAASMEAGEERSQWKKWTFEGAGGRVSIQRIVQW